MLIVDTEISEWGSVGTVVRGVQKLLVNILNLFWLSVLLIKGQFDLVLLLVFLNKNQMNCSGFICSVITIRWLVLVTVLLLKKSNWTDFCPFYWFCSGFAYQLCYKCTSPPLCIIIIIMSDINNNIAAQDDEDWSNKLVPHVKHRWKWYSE